MSDRPDWGQGQEPVPRDGDDDRPPEQQPAGGQEGWGSPTPPPQDRQPPRQDWGRGGWDLPPQDQQGGGWGTPPPPGQQGYAQQPWQQQGGQGGWTPPPGPPGFGQPPQRRLNPLIPIGIGALVVIAIVAFVVSRQPDRDEQGTLTEGGTLSVLDLQVGDCVMDPLAGEESGSVEDIEAVACEESHDAEVFGLLDHPAGEGEAFIGADAMTEFANTQCEAQFEPYVGIDYASSRYYYWTITPTDGTWNQGDREVVCLAHDLEGPITGSIRGAAE
jgi:hypothetical protein